MNQLQKFIDLLFSIAPFSRPKAKDLNDIRVIAHRGRHDGAFKENTLQAFTSCIGSALWGVEMDVQWTKDNIPVIHHDPHCGRIFKRPDLIINQLSFPELRKELPEIPSLAEIIAACGEKLHLMIEVKSTLTEVQSHLFHDLLTTLKPVTDFHILSLNEQHFQSLGFLPSNCLLPVAELNLKHLSQLAISQQWAGLSGHYLLLSDAIKQLHHEAQQKVGVGFVNSKKSLYREISRECDWLFTDKASLIDSELRSLSGM